MSGRTYSVLLALLFCPLAAASQAWAGISVLQESVSVNQTAGEATFTIDFPQPPDFFTLDSHGRAADSFQVFISPDVSSPDPFVYSNLSAVIRGDEIHFGKGVVVRNAMPAVSGNAAGGWGSVRGTVPFTLSGDTLAFSTPLSTIGASNGRFAYQSFITHYGAETASSHGVSVPLPSALPIGLGMLGIGVMFSARRSPKVRRQRLWVSAE